MKLSRSLIFYFILFLVAYGLLFFSLTQPAVEKAGLPILGNPAVSILKTLLPQATFAARLNTESERTELMLGYQSKAVMEQAKRSGQRTNVQFVGYKFYLDTFAKPFAFFLALFLITPLSWKRKGIALLIGGLVMWLYFQFEIYLFLRQNIAESQIGIYGLSGFGQTVYATLTTLTELGFGLVLAVALWLALVFRHTGWAAQLEKWLKKVNKKKA